MRRLALFAAATVLLVGLSFLIPAWMASQPKVARAPASPSDYARSLARLDAQVLASEQHAARYSKDWAHYEELAGLYGARATLSGDHEDYLRADRALQAAFALVPEAGGPLLARASHNFSIHRLPAVTADLERVGTLLLRAGEFQDLIALRADTAFHTGNYPQALAGFQELHAKAPHPGSAFRLALYSWKTGDFAQADRWLAVGEEMIREPRGRARAWFALQRGLVQLDRGQLDAAMAHYERADTMFSGWWLIEEHKAEIYAARGEHVLAEKMYRDLIERTNNPEFMVALAEVLASRDPAGAQQWITRATALHTEWLGRLPEASYGHALEHFLEHGDPAYALDLANRNYTLRPGGAASTLLAQALLLSGRCDDARVRIERTLATPFRTAGLHATAAKIFERCGDPADAASQRVLAEGIHPQAMDDVVFLAAKLGHNQGAI